MNYSDLPLQQKADLILKYLKEDWPKVTSPMYHRNIFEFLIAVMLSPQTNDETTNKVTPVLFKTYDSPEKLSEADPDDIIKIIRSVNYNKTKAVRIISASKKLIEDFDGKVPHTMNDLLTLPGVGRKVANVMLNDWYATTAEENPPFIHPSFEITPHPNPLPEGEVEKIDSDKYNSIERGGIEPTGFVVDTHVLRVSQALRLTEHKTADKVEKDLIKIFPPSEWMGTSIRMIYHGRNVFQAKKPEFRDFPKWKEVYESLGY